MVEIMDVACFKCKSYKIPVTEEPCKSCDSVAFHGNFEKAGG